MNNIPVKLIIMLLYLLHNFIRVHDPEELKELDILGPSQHLPSQLSGAGQYGGNIGQGEQQEASSRRDRIAKEMWDSYVAYLEEVN